MPVTQTVSFRGLEFLETVTPQPSAASSLGTVIWEMGRDKAVISEMFDPGTEGSLDAARDRIHALLLAILPADTPRGGGVDGR